VNLIGQKITTPLKQDEGFTALTNQSENRELPPREEGNRYCLLDEINRENFLVLDEPARERQKYRNETFDTIGNENSQPAAGDIQLISKRSLYHSPIIQQQSWVRS